MKPSILKYQSVSEGCWLDISALSWSPAVSCDIQTVRSIVPLLCGFDFRPSSIVAAIIAWKDFPVRGPPHMNSRCVFGDASSAIIIWISASLAHFPMILERFTVFLAHLGQWTHAHARESVCAIR